MKRIILLIFLIAIILSACSGSVSEMNSTIRIKGSDTMLYLTKILAREYMKTNPGISVYVEGGGTVTGIKALAEGEIDICTASRPLEGEDIKLFAEKFRSIGVSTLIAKDALCIYVNLKNPVNNLEVEQLKHIFICNINDWVELGWDNEKIILVGRNTNSGTYLYFKEHVLDGNDYCDQMNVEPTTESLVRFVSANQYAIGYGGIGYVTDSVKTLKINGLSASKENVLNDKYPISRYLHFYTIQPPQGKIKDFIDWVISDEGQKFISQSGYISIWSKNLNK